MTRVVGLMSEFIVGGLLHMIEDDVMNVVLPPAFGTDANAQDFDWVTHEIHGAMWSNYQFVDAGNNDENFMHMVLVAPLTVFRVDPKDQVHPSALGLWVEPPPQFTYKIDLMKLGYEVASQFASALKKGQSVTAAAVTGVADVTVPVNVESTGPGAVPENDSRSVSKAAEKCKVKSSTKSWAEVADDSMRCRNRTRWELPLA